MSTGLVIFAAVAVAIILGGGAAVFVALRRRAPALAVLAGLATSAALVLLFPLPIHGGFMLLGEALLDELSDEMERAAEARERRTHERYVAGLAERFAGELPILSRAPAGRGWQRISHPPGTTAWLDTTHGQVWSGWLALHGVSSMPSLEVAKKRCREYAPAGYWSLPTEAEHALMWKAGGAAILPATDAGSVSYVVDAELRMETPTFHLGPSDNAAPGPSRGFAVRCVARAPGGPARGYIQRDVPLADWNRYQLSKSM